MCVDLWDLNKASPKDDVSLPYIDLLIDNTYGPKLLSFRADCAGIAGLNMSKKIEKKATFVNE